MTKRHPILEGAPNMLAKRLANWDRFPGQPSPGFLWKARASDAESWDDLWE